MTISCIYKYFKMQRINNLSTNLTASGNKNSFSGLDMSPPDGIFGLVTKFKNDTVRNN